METNLNLMQYERDALLDAIRRDMRNEEQLSYGSKDAQLHAINYRRDRSLLETLNPKN